MQIHFIAVVLTEHGSVLSHDFKVALSEAMSRLVKPSPWFIKKYGRDFDVHFYFSTKSESSENEIRGPGVYRKGKDVEYSINLPFDVIRRSADIPQSALTFLFHGACTALERLQIDTARLVAQQDAIIRGICTDPALDASPRDAFDWIFEDETQPETATADSTPVEEDDHVPSTNRREPIPGLGN